MNRLKRSPLHGSVVALALTAVALLATLLLRPYLEPDVSVLFLVVWMCAWYYGRTVGLVAIALPPSRCCTSFSVPTPPFLRLVAALRLVAFVIVAGMLTWMTAAWRDGRRLFGATLASIGDAVLVTDADGRITFLNPVAETLTGWPLADARGKPAGELLKLLAGKDREAIDNPVARASASA